MKFEKFLLDDYMQTPEGRKVTDFFKDFKNIFFHKQDVFFQFVNSLLDISIAESVYSTSSSYGAMFFPIHELKFGRKKVYTDISTYVDHFQSHFTACYDEIDFNQAIIPFLSILHTINHPKYAFPYLFPDSFHKFETICRLFDIPIPPIPGRTKSKERFCYYFELCRAMYEFRIMHDLTQIELYTFLYGFAPRFLEKDNATDLPEPNRIFMVGASPSDVETVLNQDFSPDEVCCWQGPLEVETGDIILLYERAPYKRIGSIWRAIAPSFDDPFSSYSGKIYVNHAIQNLPVVTYDDLLSDDTWKKNGLIRCNMQGIGFKNTSITHEEYEALKRLFQKKDPSFDLSKLPEPPPYAQFFHEELETEHDVEEQLLEPFLEKIGYNVKKEFTRQFPVRMGRGFRYYPDYALHATGKRGNEHADFIWEAKYRIPTRKQLQEDFGQAESYAFRLQCKGMGLVSQEGIWLSLLEDHFNFEKLQAYSWSDLENPDIFGKVKSILYRLCRPSSVKKSLNR